MWFFTSDEHYGHASIIRLCRRPFDNVDTMDAELISRHNAIVRSGDVVVHAGDFTPLRKSRAKEYVRQLNGEHIFVRGSHDRWLGNAQEIWEREISGRYIVVCHYAMRVWPRSHHNSWQLYGHSHGMLEPTGKQWDVGVDNNEFFPVSVDKVREIMRSRPDNPNFVKGCQPGDVGEAHTSRRLSGCRTERKT